LLEQPRVVQFPEVGEPDSIWVSIQNIAGQAKSEPCLAGAARSGERDQARFAKKAAQLRQLALATDEGAELGGQVVRRGHGPTDYPLGYWTFMPRIELRSGLFLPR
jgi:hypothetical protein